MLLCPLLSVRRLAYLPLALDPGCLLLLLTSIYFFGIKKGHKR